MEQAQINSTAVEQALVKIGGELRSAGGAEIKISGNRKSGSLAAPLLVAIGLALSANDAAAQQGDSAQEAYRVLRGARDVAFSVDGVERAGDAIRRGNTNQAFEVLNAAGAVINGAVAVGGIFSKPKSSNSLGTPEVQREVGRIIDNRGASGVVTDTTCPDDEVNMHQARGPGMR